MSGMLGHRRRNRNPARDSERQHNRGKRAGTAHQACACPAGDSEVSRKQRAEKAAQHFFGPLFSRAP
jgi:hypothetical protein